ncbi:hypothetical protein D3C76_979890 [compost metagenome]
MAVTVQDRHCQASHAVEHSGVAPGVAEVAHVVDFGTQQHFVVMVKVLQPRQVVADHLVPLLLRQEGQDRQAALPHAQRHAAADVAGKGTDRVRPFAAVQAHGIEPRARQQKQRIAQRSRQPQQAGAHHIAQVARLPGLGRQGKEIQAQAITLAGGALVDHALLDQATQQPMGGGLRQANPQRQLADLLALPPAIT